MKYQVYKRDPELTFRGPRDISPEELKKRFQKELDRYRATAISGAWWTRGGWWHVRITDAWIGEVEASSEDEAIATMSRATRIHPKYLYAQAAN
ncbi:hypothetical protein MYX06_02455 [Patescibacteria group bacterium AH-259-L05]|nr:hypothetical protein [Patescibacteria group bacterium AH-259-L05]